MNKLTSDNSSSNEQTPSDKASRVIIDPNHPEAGRGGVVPPVETRFKPGSVPNPKGRPSAGASYAEWVNEMREWDVDDLFDLVRSKRKGVPALKIKAARDILLSACPGDVADYEAVCNGSMTLDEARDKGLLTDQIKKVKTRTVSTEGGNSVLDREVELKDDSHRSIERVLDRTAGKPQQHVEVDHKGAGLGIIVRIEDGAAPVLPPPPGKAKSLPEPEHEHVIDPNSTPDADVKPVKDYR